MKKRILTLFTVIAILSTFSMNFIFATSTPSTGTGTPTVSGEAGSSGEPGTDTGTGGNTTPTVSGDQTPTTTPSGDLVPNVSGDTTPNVSGDISGDISGDVSGEVITVTAYDEQIEIDKNTILTANFKATSTVPNATLSYLIVEKPAHGTLVHTKESDKSFTYTPDLDYVGTDSFTFKVSDGTSISNIATISITISVPAEEIIPFNYIDMQNHWANYSASHLAARGLIIGEEIGSRYYFYPERQMTRADFILFLLAITESNEDATIEIPKVTFADEKNTPDWLIEAAKLAYAKGIIKGSAEGNKLYLNAYNPLSRKEAVVMIDNVLTLTNSTERLTYEDTSLIPEWATQAVKNLTAYKIIQGDSENRFSPNKIITRAEAAEMCYKTVKQLESEEMPNISGDKITSGDTSGDIK